MKRFFSAGVLFFLILAGCVALPAQQPWQSPLTFSSPLLEPQRHTYFLPLMLRGPQPALAITSKKGISLACGYDDMARMANEVETLRVSWIWNWSTNPPVFVDVESVPCIWDASVIGQPLGGNSEWLLGFNEPEQSDQSNMTPAQAARAWAVVEQTYPDRKLTSPQVVRWDKRWLEEWYAAYQAQNDGRPPRLDAIAIHTYLGNNLAAYQEQVRFYIGLAEQWGIDEVWVTEFTIAPGLDRTLRESIDDQRAYLKWLEVQPFVTRYAMWTNRVECMTSISPDSFFDTPLYRANGMLTEMGKMYSNFNGVLDAE